jgi:hypothetical protein
VSYSSPNSNPNPVLALLGLVVAAVVFLAYGAWQHSTARDVTITVKSLDDQATGSGGHQYLVFTDQGVFKDADAFWFWKFNSSDVYNQLTPGKTYRCQVAGRRIHITSSYANLIKCAQVSSHG